MAAIPDLIEIIPPAAPLRAVVGIPGSKSITNRALLLAALANGRTVLNGALWSEDTQVMVDCLSRLGYAVQVEPSATDPSNRTITVQGKPAVPDGGSPEQPLELFVGNAGTAARFLCAMVCLGHGAYRLTGVPRMHERPQEELILALRELGYRIDAPTGRFPAVVHGSGPRAGHCQVSLNGSSQFASALLLAQRAGGWGVDVVGENPDETPYVTMTRELVRVFPSAGGEFNIEPDASSASYFAAANFLLSHHGSTGGSTVHLQHAPASNWQVDGRFETFLPLPGAVSRARDLGDSILTAMVVAPFAAHPVQFLDLARLRVQECDRVFAMKEGLSRCGAILAEEGDSLTIHPSAERLHGAEIESFNDHRIAMCFAVLGLMVSGIKIRNPACVKKTFPNFFQKLALPQPAGLGTVILHGRTGDPLPAADLFAD